MTNSDGGAPQGPYPQQPSAYPQPDSSQQPNAYPTSAPQGAPQGYPQAGGPQPYPSYGSPYPPARPTNTLAIITIIAAFVFPIVGIVTGHIALGQLKTSGEQGEGLAKAGLIISYVYSAIVIVVLLISIVLPLIMVAAFVPFWATIPTSP
ncbi:DUF4190 domain-containing protein [Labedella endophytica]|uniref:DUF4190 domain-containing protein n=1 Tax=Labedella endophytica TaxID=1523160 RepID=A0A3S0VS15_9MICO|nr:DUF4190 domain-containing protein [Labedella endophytica]RUQ98930.1 DUF4190 domain-containing protein [Labedella endophytica]